MAVVESGGAPPSGMAGSQGPPGLPTASATGPEPTPPSCQEPVLALGPGPSTSRYRTLRGKSVSSPRLRALTVYRDDDGARDPQDQDEGSPSLRRRSRSVTAAQLGRGGKASTLKSPPLPTFALTPRPVNLPSPNSKIATSAAAKAFGKLRQPSRLNLVRPSALDNRGTDKSAAPPPPSPLRPADSPPEVTTEIDNALIASEVARLEAETDRIIAEQKKLDLARLEAQLEATATTSVPSQPPARPKILTSLGKLSFLSRAKWSGPDHQPGSVKAIALPLFSPITVSPITPPETPPISPRVDKMNFIEAGGKGIVPQTDAPTSASNGGERRVTVRCLSSTINLPVSNDTSPIDIIFSSANFMTHQIEPDSCIVIECFVTLGLERRLRRYERVRDVMNSWDRDQQNTLLITQHDGSEAVKDLESSSVRRSEDAPPGFSVHIYHASKSCRWNKRWVTLSENGQMFACKKSDGKASDKDSIALCHLSDFDIYNPKESHLRRTLKSPKKYCYAIKSQQKTIVFSKNTENFVHYFSTEDEQLAKTFHDAVHAWRSWYLVNKQVDLQRKDRVPEASPKSKGLSRTKTRESEASTEDRPYMIGQFQPLMDMERFDKPMEEFGKTFEQEAKLVQERVQAEQKKEAERKRAKSVAKAQTRPLQMPLTPQSPKEFSAEGLLGNEYEKRKQSNTVASPTSPKQDGPFTDGPSLLRQASLPKAPEPEKKVEAESWFPSATQHSAMSRVHTRTVKRPTQPVMQPPRGRAPPQPLLNLTPDSARRPGTRSGQGVKPPTGAPLIDFATGGPNANAFQNEPQRGVPRRSTGGTRMGPSGQPPLAAGSRPRAKSSASQSSGRNGRQQAENRPPMPALPHRSGRREVLTQQGENTRARRPDVPAEPLVNHAR